MRSVDELVKAMGMTGISKCQVSLLVVFDRPHLTRASVDSWLRAKYGLLTCDWREDIRQGFAECY